ncbi:MAG: hypothetical protein E4H40_05560 [Candidatus Brocadiia bacterium]|nr:MAG: hypothetical protein E4H40_05560 [Candidatus Brocadiia bacterium]
MSCWTAQEGVRAWISVRGGLYISVMQVFQEDSVIDVTIPVKGDMVTVKAQVQYCQPGIGMGIEFVEMDDRQKAVIKELIEGLKNSP